MKKKYVPTKAIVLVLMFFSLFASAQTEKQIEKITALYNKTYLRNFADQALEKSTAEKKEAVQFALTRNLPITFTTKDGGYAELQKVLPDGTLIYYRTYNKDAAASTRTNHLNIGGSTGYDLDGQNMIAYVWDGGHPRVTHQEYDGPGGNNRITLMDTFDEGGVQLNFHAAHVVGTIGASGVQPQAKGMAPQSKVKAYIWNNDLGEAAEAAANGMLISNHSYGYDHSVIPDQWSGAYREEARDWDGVMFNAPYFLMVKAAGNDGEDNLSNTSPLGPGYDKLNHAATAKNNLVVAAANDATVDSNGNLTSVSIADFSSQGPTDDLRIKPDIAANGVDVYSTFEASDTDYYAISGTSMASPNVTGSLLLLQQHYNDLFGDFMRAATLKGLALHTADDQGPVGPDAIWGWGFLNSKKAAETITQNGANSLIQELVISQGETIILTVNSDGINDLMASISWTDRPGIINETLNSPTAILVNDLDIRVQKESTTYFPWRLTAYNANANDGDNNKDPYERVEVQNASDNYTITITHKGTLVGESQNFSLIVTGVEVNCVADSGPQNIEVNNITGSTALVSWDLVSESTYDLRYRKAGTFFWTEVLDISDTSYILTDLIPTTSYELQVRNKCPEGITSEYSDTVNFTTANLTYCDSAAQISDATYHISNVTLNTINNTSTESTYTDFTDVSTELVAGQTYTIYITPADSGTSFETSYSVWIDYNGNENFSDPGEQVFITENMSSNTIAEGSFTVPLGTNPLSTTMRVSMINDSSSAGPCDIFGNGEVEDYTVNISASECTAPELTLIAQDVNGEPINCVDIAGEFYVFAALSGGEGNNSYNISANGEDSVEVIADGYTTFGPFLMGTSVNVTAVGVQDNLCSVSIAIDPPDICPPTNDYCTDAISLSCGDSIAGSTYLATISGMTRPSCAFGTPADLFYTIEAMPDINYTVTVQGDDYDGVLVLYSGGCGSLTEIACADDGFSAGMEETIEFSVDTPTTILVRTYDWSATRGNFTISLSCEGSVTYDCPELEANIGDICYDSDGNEGLINEDCECIIALPCEAPEVLVSVVDANQNPMDCVDVDGQYYVLVTLSGGSGNSSYTLYDNNGDILEANLNSTYLAGPYNEGDTVSFTVEGNDDDTCSADSEIANPVVCDVPCEAPEVLVSVVDASQDSMDCVEVDGQYYVLVTLSGGSGNSSYTLYDNNGDILEANLNSTYLAGPYNAGTSVSFTAEGNDDDTCSADSEIVNPVACDIPCEAPEVLVSVVDANQEPMDCVEVDGQYYVLVTLSGGSGNTSYTLYDNNGDILEANFNSNYLAGPYNEGETVSFTAEGNDDDTCSADSEIVNPVVCDIPCEAPEVLVSVVDANQDSMDCVEVDGQYYVLVTLSGGSGNSSYTLYDNNDTELETNFTSTFLAGPYEEGETVSFTAEGNDDDTCSVDSEIVNPVVCDTPCEAPEISVSLLDEDQNPTDCVDSVCSYYVLVTLSGGSGNSSYTLYDNNGTELETNFTSTYIAGPYDAGTSISFTAEGNDDDSCSADSELVDPEFCEEEPCELPYNSNTATCSTYISSIDIAGFGISIGNTDFDFSYTSNTIATDGYEVIYAPILTIYPGLESVYTLRSGPDGNTDSYYYSLWIDSNQNGCFEVDEQIIWSNDVNWGVDVTDVSHTFSTDLTPGTYQARIRNSKNDYPWSEGDGDGEALDFTILVITEAEADLILGVDSQVFTDFAYYPNPVEGQLNLQAGTPIEQVEIYNLLGQQLIQVRPNALETHLDTYGLQTGVYLMNVTIDGKQKSYKIMKK